MRAPPATPPVVTQQTIADAACVHVTTVSLALRNAPSLPAATRRRIRAIAQRLGYAPNPLVSLLMARVRRGRSPCRGTLAFVHTLPSDAATLQGAVHRNFLAGARRRAAELGYALDEFFLDATPSAGRRLAGILQARGIVGAVVEHVPSPACPGRRLPFDLTPFAVASLGVPLASPPVHYVANDQFMRAVLAAGAVLRLGYRRPGLVIYDRFDTTMAHRLSAGFWAVQAFTRQIAALPICRLPPGNQDVLPAWLDAHQPDVVLGTNERILTALRAMGRRVPADLGWVHLDWLPQFRPQSGVYGNSEHTGAAAVELVVSQLHRGEAGPPPHPVNYLVSGTWIRGRTVRRVGPPLELNTSFFNARAAAAGRPEAQPTARP